MNRSIKRVAAAALAIIMVAGYAPATFNGVKLFDTAITASAVEVSETIAANQGGKDYTSTNFKVSGTDGDGDGLAVGLLHNSPHTVTVSSLNGETIKKIEATVGWMEHNGSLAVNPGNLSGFTYVYRGGCDISVTDVNATSVTFTQPSTDWGALVQLKTFKIYYDGTDVSGINLNKTSTTLTIGDSETLQATVLPDDAFYKTVTWSSDNEEVATVDENGNVTAVKAGTATITATATNGTDDTTDDKTATCAVNVQTAPTYAPVLAQDLTYNGSEQDLVTGNGGEGGTIHYVYRKSGDTAWTAVASGYPQVKDVGTYEVGWYSDESDDYLAAASALVPNIAGTVTIAKADAAVKTAPEAVSGLIANGEYQELVTAGEAEGGKLVYAIGDENGALEPYTELLSAAADAGTYYVWYKVEGDENHNDSEPASIEVTIADAKIDISEGTVTADPENKTVTVTVDGKTVPASEYHIIYFTYEKTADGESLTRVGTDYPTEPGTYIAAVVANEDSETYIGENRSEPFTIAAPEPAKDTEPSDTPPQTGAAAGMGALAVAAAAVIAAKKRK